MLMTLDKRSANFRAAAAIQHTQAFPVRQGTVSLESCRCHMPEQWQHIGQRQNMAGWSLG